MADSWHPSRLPSAPGADPPRPNPPGLAAAAAHHRAGRLAEAEELYRRALNEHPNHAPTLHRLGMLAFQRGRADEAERLIRQSLDAAPDAEAWNNLCGVLGSLGRHAEAADAAREAIRLRPGYAAAHNNLGVALEQAGRLDEALAALEAACSIRPDYAEAFCHRGNVLWRLGRLRDAEAAHRDAIRLQPAYAAAHQNLATTLCETGRSAEAVAHYRQVVRLRPDNPADGSNLLYALHYLPGISPQVMLLEHLRWASRHARPAGAVRARGRTDPERPLRVGYVSPDLRRHAVAMFFEPLLLAHDRERFETFCYSASRGGDAVTDRLRSVASRWCGIAGLSDGEAAARVRADEIDILVDLAGHGAGNRLPLFARRPAPVQVTYLGYPDTTGMAAIDYRLTDAVADPPGLTDPFHAERLVRLPGCAWCYRPPDDAPPVAPLPAAGRGFVTFGSFNNPAKVTPQVVSLWSRLLAAVPGSRLLLKWRGMNDGAARRQYVRLGIPPDRLDLLDATPTLREHLLAYERVDLALDPFPYNGTTTTCDALWMGVPTVTPAGRTHVSRVGLSLLTTVGLGGFAVASPAGYLAAAVAAARDLPALARLRATLRGRVSASPLADGPGLARRVEAAYRRMWREACRASDEGVP